MRITICLLFAGLGAKAFLTACSSSSLNKTAVSSDEKKQKVDYLLTIEHLITLQPTREDDGFSPQTYLSHNQQKHLRYCGWLVARVTRVSLL